ncbi:MAG: hypothetical protein JXN64_05210 [Spirochaetes bacterium]|nr:hypothetical protein [Spirochaetota bacterium]
MKSSSEVLLSRGFIKESEVSENFDINRNVLCKQLKSKIPAERTKAAMIAGKMKIRELVPHLINALKIEKKLYCKIAIQKALISLKEVSIEKLIPCLGIIGKNQHRKLPSKPFEKNNYPCPRDIAARTLIYCGLDVIHMLLKKWKRLSRYQMLEAIDVIGHISFYEKNTDALPLLFELYENNKNDNVMIWKIIRAFSAFNDKRVISILNKIINENCLLPNIREAERSLRIIKKYCIL